uniref:Fibronectin type-III domain-containing protein n=1 Tax=Romanomermis culicivorax TaxID=13658 RepID=A0A915K1A7_ROMCU
MPNVALLLLITSLKPSCESTSVDLRCPNSRQEGMPEPGWENITICAQKTQRRSGKKKEEAFDRKASSYYFRAKRQTLTDNQNTGTSILTVEWEGIHNQVSNDRTIGGFAVEYRSEAEPRWIQHKGIIPYHGPNIQYKVRIRDLPSGLIYYVRIKVLGRNNEILLETPEIKAQSEAAQTSCAKGEISEPRNVRVVAADMHTLTFEWEPPQCGNINRYTYLIEGFDEYARMDYQTGSTDITRATVRNLLPGTSYTFRVRAADGGRRLGPWTDTVARAPTVSHDIKVVYKTDKQIRVDWKPYSDRQLQHYELPMVDRDLFTIWLAKEPLLYFAGRRREILVPVGACRYMFAAILHPALSGNTDQRRLRKFRSSRNLQTDAGRCKQDEV